MAIELSQLLEGLEPEVATKVTEQINLNSKKLNAKVFIDGDDKHYVPAERVAELSNEKNQLKESLESQSTQLENLSTLTKDNEEAQKTIANLQSQNAQLQQVSKRSAILAQMNSAVTDSIAPVSDLMEFLAVEDITVKEDGTVIGLDEQLKTVREKRSYLFKPTDPNGGSGSGAGGNGGAGTGAPGGQPGGLPGAQGTGGQAGGRKIGELGKQLAAQVTQAQTQSDQQNNFWK